MNNLEKVLEKLYSYEYFPIYLVVSIIVLVLLFIVVLFFGKKDKKKREIEATKKLQQINTGQINLEEVNAFKETSTPSSVEINAEPSLENTVTEPAFLPNMTEVKEENEVIPEPILPKEEPTLNISTEPVMPEVTPVENHKETPTEVPKVPENNTSLNEINTNIEINKEEGTPILEKVEEKPFVFASEEPINAVESNTFKEEPTSIPEVNIEQKETKVPENTPNLDETTSIRVPEFNFDELVKETEEVKKEETPVYQKGPEIFSSVYVPEKEDKVEIASSTNEEFELPSLKKEPDVNKKIEESKVNVEEEKTKEEDLSNLEMPVFTDYKLDEISGESYNINK